MRRRYRGPIDYALNGRGKDAKLEAMNSKPPIVGGRTTYRRNGHSSAHKVITLVFGALIQAAKTVAAPLKERKEHVHDDPDPEDASIWLYLGVAAVLVLLGGAFAGLTIA